ncbi:MAG: GNAT family N-acetyltransferase [bacterium]|nr:GNAT family N-acetyltransferase [bacterium]
MMNNKKKYREFCTIEQDIPIFSKDWWLDCVCGKDNWDVCLIEKGGKIVASMPYFLKKKLIFQIITMPRLTQTMGSYIKYPKEQRYYKKLSWEKEIIIELIKQIPKVDVFIQNFDCSIINWLPFYWQGYKQTTRYTYKIKDISVDHLENICETDIRRRKRKALNLGVKIIDAYDIESFYELNKKTFERKNMKISYDLNFVKKLYIECEKHNAVKMYCAEYDSKIIAANFLVVDQNSVYYLLGGIDADYKDLGGMDLIQLESIKFALANKKEFDFEGSMVENIEKYFRSFGAIQRPYFQVTKINSKILKIREFLK